VACHFNSIIKVWLSIVLMTSAFSLAAAPFKYDPATGVCRDDSQTIGLNPLDRQSLFANGTVTQTKQIILVSRDAECVDFSGFDLYGYLKSQGYQSYIMLRHWNLRGAKLDHTNLSWTVIEDADLEGTDIRQASLGYSTIQGTIDRFTTLNSACNADGNHVECRL